MTVFHIAALSDWGNRTAEHYRPATLAEEGFVHCSSARQVVGTANSLFNGRTDLTLLSVDESKLTSPLVWEDSYASGTDFPHVYGPIDIVAISDVRQFPPDPNGGFDWWAPDPGNP